MLSLRPLEICSIFQSESGVYKRQILTYKVGPRAERVKAEYAEKVKQEKYRQSQQTPDLHDWFNAGPALATLAKQSSTVTPVPHRPEL